MNMIKTRCSTEIVPEVAPMWKIDSASLGMPHRAAPLSVNGTGWKSAFSTLGVPTSGPVVVTDARVRDAEQAAPPRGTRC